MKRFQSRIESLRRVRQQAEQLARLEAAVRQGEKVRADRKVESLRQQLASLQDRSIREMTGEISASVLQSLANASLLAETEVNHARGIQHQAAAAVTQAVAVVVHAQSQLNIVDDYRDREFAKYRKEQLRHEENTRQDTNSRRRQRSIRMDVGSVAERQNTTDVETMVRRQE